MVTLPSITPSSTKMHRFSALSSVILQLSICLLSLQCIRTDQSVEDLQQTALQTELVDEKTPIETLFGDGYICLHVTDPKYKTSPAFQALADELSKKYNRKTVVHEIGSEDADTPHGHKSTVHYEVSTTPAPPQNLVRPTQKPKQIPVVCEHPGYFSNPNNCTWYYRCVEPVARGKPMKPIHFECGPGTIFHERIQGCDHPNSVVPKPPCWKSDDGYKGERGQSKKTTTTTPAPIEDISQVQTGRIDSDEDGQTEQRPDPAPIHHDKQKLTDEDDQLQLVSQETVDQVHHPDNFDFKLPPEFIDEDTDGIEQVKKDDTKAPIPFPEEESEEVPDVKPVCTETGTFGHPTNCSRYHECLPSKGKLILREHVCPGDQIFDDNEGECKKAQNVDPKPPCWHKKKKKRITEKKTVIEEVISVKEPAPVKEPEDSEEVVEHFDSFESSGVTQKKVKPGKTHIREEVITKKVEEEEVIESEEQKPAPPIASQVKKTKTIRKTIPVPVGVKPAAKCVKEGTFTHPTDCSKYFKCERRNGRGPIRIMYFVCSAGTVYDESVHRCRQPSEILPTVPECAKWDDKFREEFEELVEVEVSQEEQTPIGIGQTQFGREDSEEEETTTPAYYDQGELIKVDTEQEDIKDEYEIVEVDDGKGGKKHIKRKKTVKVETERKVIESQESDEVTDSQSLGGKKKKHHSTETIKRPHTDVIDESSQEIDKQTEHGKYHKEIKHKETVTTDEEPTKKGHHHHKETVETTHTKIVEETSQEIDQRPVSQEHVEEIETSGVDYQPPPPIQDLKGVESGRPDSSEEETTTIEPWVTKTTTWVTEDDGYKGGRGQPTSTTTKRPIPDDVELIEKAPPVKDCTDDLELIERLRRERDAAEAQVDILEKENAKLEQRLKKLEKDLDIAIKAKVKMTNYVKTMDKTIESYKKEVEALQLCCPTDSALEAESLDYSHKGRKRRSLEVSTKPAIEALDPSLVPDEFVTKKMKAIKLKGRHHGAHLPIHATAEATDSTHGSRISPPIDTSIKTTHEQQEDLENDLQLLVDLQRMQPESDHFSHMPFLIFATLVGILLSCMFLGCFIIRRLNKITTYGISPEELQAYAQLQDGEMDSVKTQTLRQCAQKRALRQGVYFAYVDE